MSEVFNKSKISILKNVFISCFIAAVILYAYSYTNYIPAYDGIAILSGTGGAIGEGRWFIVLLFNIIGKFLDFYYVIPQANIIVGMIFVALSAYFLIITFDINNTFNQIIISLFYISSTAICDLVAWTQVIHAYSISLFFITLSAYFYIKCVKFIYKYCLSVLFFVLSLAIYQAFLPVFLTMLLISLIKNVYNIDRFDKKTVILAIKYLVHIVICMIIYIISCKIAFFISAEHSTGYRAMSENIIPNLSLTTYIFNIIKSFIIPFALPFVSYASINATLFSKIIIFVYLMILIISLFVKLKNADIFKIMFLLLLYILLPISICFFKIMTTLTSTRMTFSLLFVFILPLLLFNDDMIVLPYSLVNYNFFKNVKITNLFKVIIVLVLINICFCDLSMNFNLYKGNKLIEHWTNQIVAQIRNTPGYNNEMKIAMVGNLDGGKYDKSTFLGVNLDVRINHNDIYNIFYEYYYKRYSYFADFANFSYQGPDLVSFDDVNSIDYSSNVFYTLDTDPHSIVHSTDSRIKAMPCYPTFGYIQIIDDIIVVKFND